MTAHPGPRLLLSDCFLDPPLEGGDGEQQPSPTHDQADSELLSQYPPDTDRGLLLPAGPVHCFLTHNSSLQVSSMCYIRAFIAPLAWTLLTKESKNNWESEDYEALLWAAAPVLQLLPPGEIELPDIAAQQKLEQMCVSGCWVVVL